MNGMVFFALAVLSVQQFLVVATYLDNPGTVFAVGLLSFLFVGLLFITVCCFKQRRGHGEAIDEVRPFRPDGPFYPDGEDIRTPIQEVGSPYPMQFVGSLEAMEAHI